MASNPRDANRVPTISGVSSVDGTTPVVPYVDPTTHRLYVNAGAAGITIGTTTITSGSNGRILYDNNGIVGEMTTTGSGTVVALATGAALVTPALGVATATSLAIGGATIGTNGLAVTGHILVEGVTTTGATGTGKLVFDTAPQLSTIELGAATDTTLSRVSAGVIAVEGVTIADVSSAQTLTTKRITKRIGTEASSATSTPTADTVDQWNVTALAAADAVAAPTGSPTDGQELIIRIKDNGTARALTWNAIYRASSDLALPSTTILSKTLYLGFKYNAADTKWDLLALLNNF